MRFRPDASPEDEESLLMAEKRLRSPKNRTLDEEKRPSFITRCLIVTAVTLALLIFFFTFTGLARLLQRCLLISFTSRDSEYVDTVDITVAEIVGYEWEKLQDEKILDDQMSKIYVDWNQKGNKVRYPVPAVSPSDDSGCALAPPEQKFDCYPQSDPSQTGCEARGCCWILENADQPGALDNNGTRKATLGQPSCFYPYDYKSYFLIESEKTPNGFSGTLMLVAGAVDVYPERVGGLGIQVYFETSSRLRVKIFDANNQRYEVPLPVLPDPPQFAANKTLYDIQLSRYPFYFRIYRKDTGTLLFDTSAGVLSFYDQFVELSSYLPSRYIYGLGEHLDNHFMHSVEWNRFTFWTTDIYPDVATPLYGVHPFYLSMEDNGNSHGVFLLNSNAMDVILQPAPAITYRTTGGILDFYFFLGPSPGDVIAQYIDLIGKPALPPYWALGFHLCRWGYLTLENTQDVLERNIAAGIPLDVQWNDLDYMNGSRDFTVDSVNFAGLKDFVSDLQTGGMRYVLITDPAISSVEKRGTYPPFDDALKEGCLVTNASGYYIEGRMWTGFDEAYPDFTNPQSLDYWSKQIARFHAEVGFDGLWIDMNEPSSFITGSTHGCPDSSLESPPYLPHIAGQVLATRTLCMTAKHYLGFHYDLHSLYGIFMAKATRNALLTLFPKKRPFILSRSTFAGHGQFSAHWTGDVSSDWSHLKSSVAEILGFNMFGIPFVGADICGFSGDTTDELCLRWHQLGAFYPFSRNHNSNGQRDQDPASFPPNITTSIQNSLLLRYLLLPYFSTLLFRATMNGTTVVRPLFFEYPQDHTTYSIDCQFLLGRGLMVSPVLTPNTTQILAYFPDERWFDFHTGTEMYDTEWQTLDAGMGPEDLINLHLRGGSIIPQQFPVVGQQEVITTTLARSHPFKLSIAPDEDNAAFGELIVDDGEQDFHLEENLYSVVEFHLGRRNGTKNLVLWSKVVLAGYEIEPSLQEVDVFGVDEPQLVFLDGASVKFTYDSVTLSIGGMSVDLMKEFKVELLYQV